MIIKNKLFELVHSYIQDKDFIEIKNDFNKIIILQSKLSKGIDCINEVKMLDYELRNKYPIRAIEDFCNKLNSNNINRNTSSYIYKFQEYINLLSNDYACIVVHVLYKKGTKKLTKKRL